MEFFAAERAAIKEIKMPRYQDTNRAIGYAHLMFSEQGAYETARGKNGQKMGQRYLEIKPASGQNGGPSTAPSVDNMPDDCVTLFVKNLPYTMAEDDIGDRFRHYGEIANIRVAYNSVTKMSKGFAYIEFKEHSSAKVALMKMHGRMINGRPLHVDYDANKAKQSYKPREETERNRLYNREALREDKTRHVRKERENKRMELIKKQ